MKEIRFLVVGLLAMVFTSVSVFGYSGGSGIEADPYLIDNKADLLELGATTSDYGKCFKMTSDIDLSSENFTMAVIAMDTNGVDYEFQGTGFSGGFDGNGCKILNLLIDGGTTNDYIGLFGYLYADAEVKNLGVVDCNVNGDYYVGGLFGWTAGSILS